MTGLLRGRPITIRITVGFLLAMAVLLLATSAFVYERMEFALDRSISDVPSDQRVEIAARRAHRDEALAELLVQLAVAYAGTLAIAGFVGYRATRAALGPVERMREQAAASAAETDFQLPVSGADDELSRLATTLNGLLAQLRDAAARERRLLADASHELRTPLSRLQMRVDLALSRHRSPDELRAALAEVQVETARLVRLANDLLLIAQAAGGRLPLRADEIALLPLVRAARGRFADTAAAAGRTIELEVSEDELLVADPDRLAQALDNLLENALRHGRGTVTVRSERREGALVVRVADEGPGFAPDVARRAFDRFVTTDARGHGLGLAIVHAIAESHGGTTGIDSSGERGNVWFALPSPG